MRITTLTAGAAALVAAGALALVATAGPSTAVATRPAKPQPTPTPTATVPPPPDASGCYAIVGGEPGYQRVLSEVTQEEAVLPGSGLYEKAVVNLTDRGVVYGNLVLDGVSCLEATYVLEVFSSTATPDGAYPRLARTEVKGDGMRQALALDTVVRSYSGDSVRVVASVLDPFGRVIDTGGDAQVLTALPDGEFPPGGGTVAWR